VFAYSTTIRDAAKITNPVAGALSLWAWVESSRGELATDGPARRPVRLTISQAAAITGRHPTTVRRAWPAWLAYWREVAPDTYEPRADAWTKPEPAPGRSCAAWIPLQLEPLAELWRTGRNGWTAARLALELARRARAAAAVGRSAVVWSLDQITRQLGAGRSAVTRAFRVLEIAGWIRRQDRGRRRAPAIVAKRLAELWTAPKPTAKARPKQRAQRDHSKVQNGTAQRERIDQPQEAAARGPAASAAAKALIEGIPSLKAAAAAELAKHCADADQARAWIAQEAAGIQTADNPAGWFVAQVRQGCRPGKRSAHAGAWERKVRRELATPSVKRDNLSTGGIRQRHDYEPPPELADPAAARAELAAAAELHLARAAADHLDAETRRTELSRARLIVASGYAPELADQLAAVELAGIGRSVKTSAAPRPTKPARPELSGGLAARLAELGRRVMGSA
jgi:hypothetical protein